VKTYLGVGANAGAFSLGSSIMEKGRRDLGLRLAIEAKGSVRALAAALGMSASSLLEWRRVPSHRILQVEAVTGVPRELLRPELYEPPEL